MKKLIILIILVIIIAASVTMIFYTKYRIKASITMPMQLEVGDKIGFTTETEILNFGKARPGDTPIRIIELKNENKVGVTAYFSTHGDLEKWVYQEPIYLNKFESKNVTISAKIPKNTDFGIYRGVLRVIFKKS